MTLPKSSLTGYDVEEEIGRGDLTIIYRAHRREDGQPVAIKVVAPQFTSDDYFIRRFVEAGQRAARLDHPNIAGVYEAGRREDVVFVVRDWIQAESLADRLARTGAMSPAQAVPIVHQLAAALDYAHSQRLMHGDLNDRCVFISDDHHVTLTDFGLTQAMAGTDLVKTGHGVGAPEYLASERVQGQGPSRPADIYALGMLAYQMLAGRVPFTGEPSAVFHAQVHQTPLPLHTVNPNLPVALSEAVARALSKRPEVRYNTATEFARAFAVAAKGIAPIRAPAAAGRPQPLKFWQRPVFWAAVVAPVIGLFLAVILWNLAGWGERLAARLAEMASSPPPPSTIPASLVTPTLETSLPSLLVPGVSPTSTLEAIPPLSPSPAVAPTPILAPTPASLTIAEGSPFSNLVLARGISNDHQPLSSGNDFSANAQPVYLFFDYRDIEPGTRWGHVWVWGDQELDRSITTWPTDWGTAGTAWVFYTPEGGYQPGPYEVRLLVNDQMVASASFVMR
jgi:serine/threonine protein kinase